MNAEHPVIIVGAGHAGVQCAASLREEGFAGPVLLVDAAPHAPYQRPPLSKAYLKRTVTREQLALRGPTFFAEQRIETRFGDAVVRIDRASKTIHFASGSEQTYAHLVLATGARARPAPFTGADLAGVFALRDLDDADRLRGAMDAAKTIVVVGAGFIGLEFAATAALGGKQVMVVEAAPRVMGRAVSPPLSRFFADAHTAFGATVLTHSIVAAIDGDGQRATGVTLGDGSRLPADLVVVGIGVLSEDRLAHGCYLACGDGIKVDETLLADDPDISAIGDCAWHPNAWAGGMARLECVQNAADGARVVAKRLAGKTATYNTLPWFWSDQGDLKLQIAGLLRDADVFVTRGDPESRAFSIFAFAGETLRAVESVNRGGEHMAARRIIADAMPLTPQQAADQSFDLKALAMRRPPSV